MSTVAAIQMTSGHVVEDNLEAAAKLLREAKDAGAEIACLPENFSFIGLQATPTSSRVAEADGAGPVQQILERDGARARAVDPRRHAPSSRATRRDACRTPRSSIDAAGQAGRALRQDSSVRRRDSGPQRAVPRVDARHPRAQGGRRGYPGGPARPVRVLRHALSRALPRARRARRAVACDAGRIHGADRARALGDAAASARHRESVLRGGARRSGARTRAAARPMATH